MFELIYIAVGSNISRALDRSVNAVSRQCSQWIRKCFKTPPPALPIPLCLRLPDLLVQTEGFNTRKEKHPTRPKLVPSATLWTFTSLAPFGVVPADTASDLYLFG